jgi:Holliday junction DNA helicase RuvA
MLLFLVLVPKGMNSRGNITMIDRVSGAVQAVHKDSVTVNVGPMGLRLFVAEPARFRVSQAVDLYAYLHWNQENGPSLFGFESEVDKEVFLLIIDCSGIGPKIGLAVLRDLGSERFLEAVQSNDDRALCAVDGLGPKKIEQIIVQLKRKVAKFLESGIKIQGSKKLADWQNVSNVLASLNYSRTEITLAMKFLGENYSEAQVPFDGLLRHALSFLAKSR